MRFVPEVIVDNLGYFLNGLYLTVILSLIGMIASMVCGTFLCLARLSHSALVRFPAQFYIDIVRSAPLLLIIFWFVFFLPRVTGITFTPVVAGMIAITAYFATHVAEIMRAGINSIPKGQAEAGYSSGLGYGQTMRYIILPQAIRNMIPALVSRFVALFKSTSLLYIIGVIEFFRAATIVNNREFASFEIYTFVAIVYFVCCYSLSQLGEWLQRRLRAGAMRDLERSLGW
jgi:polar amino acid transport system permease protein